MQQGDGKVNSLLWQAANYFRGGRILGMTEPATPRRYTEELKAQAISEWMAGSSLRQVAARHDVPHPTVQGWMRGLTRVTPMQPMQKTTAYDFDKMALQLVDGSVRAVSAIQRATEDEAWLKRQSADQLAILYGVIADKLYRLLGAIKPGPADANP